MDKARSKILQEKVTEEAMAIIGLVGHKAEVAEYQQAVRLVGKACGIPRSTTEEQLRRIDLAREEMRQYENGEPVKNRIITNEIGANWSGMEIHETVMGLFEASLQLERCGDRWALFNLAQQIQEMQNFTDWIEKVAGEDELLKSPSCGDQSLQLNQ